MRKTGDAFQLSASDLIGYLNCRHLAVLDRAVAEGSLRPGDTSVMSSHFFALCKGEVHHRKLWNVTSNPSDEEIRTAIGEAVEMFLAAYGSEAG